MNIYKFYGYKQTLPFFAIKLEENQEPFKYLRPQPSGEFLYPMPSEFSETIDKFELIFDAKTKEIIEVRPLELTSSDAYNKAILEAIKDNHKLASDLKEIEEKSKKSKVNYETIQSIIDRYYLYGGKFEKSFDKLLKKIFENYPVNVEYVKAEDEDKNKAYRKISIPD